MMFSRAPILTANIAIIEAKMATAPKISGYSMSAKPEVIPGKTVCSPESPAIKAPISIAAIAVTT